MTKSTRLLSYHITVNKMTEPIHFGFTTSYSIKIKCLLRSHFDYAYDVMEILYCGLQTAECQTFRKSNIKSSPSWPDVYVNGCTVVSSIDI